MCKVSKVFAMMELWFCEEAVNTHSASVNHDQMQMKGCVMENKELSSDIGCLRTHRMTLKKRLLR